MRLMNIIEFFKYLLLGMELKYLCTIILFQTQRMQPLADTGMLIISTSIRKSALVFKQHYARKLCFPSERRIIQFLLKRSLSLEYNFKKIFKGTNLKPQIRHSTNQCVTMIQAESQALLIFQAHSVVSLLYISFDESISSRCSFYSLTTVITLLKFQKISTY